MDLHINNKKNFIFIDEKNILKENIQWVNEEHN